MSESDTKDNCAMENLDTCSESVEHGKLLNNSAANSTNESQDFHLMDFDDEEEEIASQPRQDAEGTETAEVSSSCLIDKVDETAVKTDDEVVADKAIDLDTAKDELVKEENAQNTDAVEEKMPDDGNSENKDKHSDEEEEIIQCTPPETYSPSKMQVAGNITNLKRKAGSIVRRTACKDFKSRRRYARGR